ncbi:hypothetical protein ABW20_dc0103567 [Dactylellina cionopaga]|nr:hypothetical protein ABW20_dc0103567 [Dactylellina cionopaga]
MQIYSALLLFGTLGLAHCYEMAFLEEPMADTGIGDTDFDQVPWTRYDRPAIDCTAINTLPDWEVKRVMLKTFSNEPEPPKEMAFYLSDPDSTGDPCGSDELMFIVKWYRAQDSLQSYRPYIGVFTHFKEIETEEIPNYIPLLDAGDAVAWAEDGQWDYQRSIVDLVFTYWSDPETPVEVEDVEDVNPNYIEIEDGDNASYQNYDDGSETVTNADTAFTVEEEEATRPARQFGDRSDLLEAAGIADLENTGAIQEMAEFEEAYPQIWQDLLNLFVELRQSALHRDTYVPIPLGLLIRYTDRELSAMGLPLDLAREFEAWEAVNAARRDITGFEAMTPLMFRLFEGRSPGVYGELLERLDGRRVEELGLTFEDNSGNLPEVDSSLHASSARSDLEAWSMSNHYQNDNMASPGNVEQGRVFVVQALENGHFEDYGSPLSEESQY